MQLNRYKELGLGHPFNINHFLSNLNQYYKAGFWYWDSESNKIHLGAKTISELGIKGLTDEVELDDFLDLVHKDDKKNLVRSFLRLCENTKLHQVVDFRIKVQNEWQWKRITAIAAKEKPSASKYYVIGQFRSINPINALSNDNTEALTFERYAKLLNKHQLALLEIDSIGTVLNRNKNSERFFLFDTYGSESISIKESFIEDEWKRFQEWLQANSVKPFTSTFKLINGTECYLSWSKLSNVQQNSKSYIVSARDVSQQVELQKQIKRFESHDQVIASFLKNIKGNFLPEEIYVLLGQTLEKVFPKSIIVLFSYSIDDSFITVESVLGIKPKFWDVFIGELGWNPVGRRFYIDKNVINTLLPSKVIENDLPLNELVEGVISATSYKIIERIFKVVKSYLSGIVKDDNLFGGIIVVQTQESEPVDVRFLSRISTIAATALDFSRNNQILSSKVDELKKQLSEKYELLSYINHSIRTPLNSIIGFSSMLDFTELDKSLQTEYLRIIQNQSKLLLDLTNELQDFVRISTGSLTIIKDKQNVNDFFEELKTTIYTKPELQEYNNINVNIVIPEHTDFLEIYTDSGRLLQALTIYCNQFIKFVQTGSISIGYSVENDLIKIFIQEDESAIDSKIRDAVAEDLNALLTGNYSHSSHFNILLANRLLTLLGGEVEIINDGKLKFEVKFSLITNEVQSQADELNEEHALKRVEFKNSVVLIVEDEEVNYLVLNELLTSWGISTIWAKNGREAVDLVSSLNQGINLILMDIRMPVMDGYAATMEIKQLNSAIPVVAQTAFSAPQERLKAQAAGCNGYITKPIDPNILHHVLEMYLA